MSPACGRGVWNSAALLAAVACTVLPARAMRSVSTDEDFEKQMSDLGGVHDSRGDDDASLLERAVNTSRLLKITDKKAGPASSINASAAAMKTETSKHTAAKMDRVTNRSDASSLSRNRTSAGLDGNITPRVDVQEIQEGSTCPDDDRLGRIGCAMGCSCRWYEACYPLTAPGKDEELPNYLRWGQCSLSGKSLVTCSLAIFCSLIACVALSRTYLDHHAEAAQLEALYGQESILAKEPVIQPRSPLPRTPPKQEADADGVAADADEQKRPDAAATTRL
eukprot:TRINITY_DN39216_c0_g1_i1.p1 TRINITY_DN39216_c0_g1~~TRINITY_DN39216_c0_g1_i1.p1  ORF type:complete len:279 (+),score=37.50 TRINITY_DN39216_c0_g1_i1:140-976(+)